MKVFIVVYLALSVAVLARAQNKTGSPESDCKVRFAIYQLNPHIPGGIAPGFSKEQGKWYEKIKRKYVTSCLGSQNPDYFVLWSSRFSSEGTPEPVINFAALSGSAGGTSFNASGYQVTTPYESESVYMTVFRGADVERAEKDSSYHPRPVYYTQQDSWWTYRKSHRKAMEDVLEFLTGTASK